MARYPSPECTCKSKEIGQTDIVVYMSNRGPPVSSLVMATTSWMLAVWLGKHRAWCSDWDRGPRCGARPLPMCGDGPENIRKRPLCIPLSRSHTGGASSCPATHSPLGSPGSLLARPLGSRSQGLNVPEGSAAGLALSEAGGHTEVTATQSRGPAVCHLPCQDRVQESISLFFKNKNKTKNG